ncbi:alpha/beta hydrolase fold domain-containing protein [Burkholderia cenocepacia]|nr:alpha/beta hydrolase fold domain-containing protein [Burkholderia cenocepacia]QUN38686.1 alpha/beta hydrolase fold domain-containing protein [Burkholderia cenocepacia]
MNVIDLMIQKALRAGLRVSFKLPSGYPFPVHMLRRGMEFGARLFKTRPETDIRPISLGGVPGKRIAPDGSPRKAMLHFHGGAFFTGSSKTHRAMGSEFAVRGKVNVYMPDYRRAPEHPYPAALDDGWAAYHALLEQGYQPHDIVLGGDSGGCALILSLAIRLRDRNLPLPAGLVMLSPVSRSDAQQRLHRDIPSPRPDGVSLCAVARRQCLSRRDRRGRPASVSAVRRSARFADYLDSGRRRRNSSRRCDSICDACAGCRNASGKPDS